MEAWKSYQEKHKERFLKELMDLLENSFGEFRQYTSAGYAYLCGSRKKIPAGCRCYKSRDFSNRRTSGRLCGKNR